MKDDIVKLYKLDVKTSVIYNPVNQIIEQHIIENGIQSYKEEYLLCVEG